MPTTSIADHPSPNDCRTGLGMGYGASTSRSDGNFDALASIVHLAALVHLAGLVWPELLALPVLRQLPTRPGMKRQYIAV